MIKHRNLSPDKILTARRCIDPVFLNSPVLTTEAIGFRLLAKDETANPIRSFKGRGAGFYLASSPDSGPLVTASAGNFGQGVAYGARATGRALTVFASVNANPLKIEAMRRLGAEVRLEGEDFDAAKAAGRAFADQEGLAFVEDGAAAEIAEGAGTIALELTEAAERFDRVYISLGNGALAAGMGCWLKHASPDTEVIAVAAAGAPCMALSHQAGRPVGTVSADTIADGIAVRVPVPEAVDWLKGAIDRIVLVDDAEILAAMWFAKQTWGCIIEPAGAAGLAAILADASSLQGLTVATPLCGGNVTEAQARAWF
jgi:threonine dehydratase